MRADARRNRDQIVAAARESFVARGVEVPMDEIARRAGVGVGTLYRRFPDREALIEAVALDMVRRVIEQAPTRHEVAPGERLWSFLYQCVDQRIGLLHSALQSRLEGAFRRNPELQEARRKLIGLMDEMVVHARESGAMRVDVGTADVLLILTMALRTTPAVAADVSEVMCRRVLEIAIEGLRSPAPRPLPGTALAVKDLVRDGETAGVE
jgi:AcrR family transcriptional regulator